MPSSVIREWLAEYKGLPDSDLNKYASSLRNNSDLSSALYEFLEDDLSNEVLDPVCHQLFDLYRSGHAVMRRFTLELVPGMISSYLSAISHNEKKKCGGMEACLLGIYNLEVVHKDGRPKVQTITIPTLAAPSVYHEPPSLATLALTESMLLRYHSDQPILITIGPFPQVERINAQNRLSVLTYVMRCYNGDMANMSAYSHQVFCRIISKLTKTGFDGLASDSTSDLMTLNLRTNHNMNESVSPSPSPSSSSQFSRSPRPSKKGVVFHTEPRIGLSSGFLVEILSGLYFVLFNGQARLAIQALEDTHQRAQYELYSDVLLLTTAIKNSLQFNPSGQPQDGPMGISIALSPTQGNPAFSKDVITNASFRAKKLPEDIEFTESEHDTSQDNPPQYDEVVLSDQMALPQTGSFSSSSSKAEPTDKASKPSASGKLTNSLKSIMKKDRSDKGSKVSRKDSATLEVIKKREAGGGGGGGASDSPKSPKHSVSMSTGLAAKLNGEVTDPNVVQVQVVRSSSSRAVVDHLEMSSGLSDHTIHKRTVSATDALLRPATLGASEESLRKPLLQPASHSRDVRYPGNNSSSNGVGAAADPEDNFTTQL